MHEPLLNPSDFLDRIFSALDKKGIIVSDFFLDHICYRTESVASYESMKSKLNKIATCLVESEINGRPIATYKLGEAFTFGNRSIDVIEIPSPKQGSAYKEGYEHVEFVIDQPFEEFMSQYPQISFDVKGIQKPFNPDIRLQLEVFSVKFHHQSLEEVIAIEKGDN